jgi:hypothetical protein
MGPDANIERLWRVRRRHDHIDAVLSARGSCWELRFLRNDRLMLAWPHERRETACADAEELLSELQLAGWHTQLLGHGRTRKNTCHGRTRTNTDEY